MENLKVQLKSTGNRDISYWQEVPNVETASVEVREYISRHGLASSVFTGGKVLKDGKFLCRISYNGRAWVGTKQKPKPYDLDEGLVKYIEEDRRDKRLRRVSDCYWKIQKEMGLSHKLEVEPVSESYCFFRIDRGDGATFYMNIVNDDLLDLLDDRFRTLGTFKG